MQKNVACDTKTKRKQKFRSFYLATFATRTRGKQLADKLWHSANAFFNLEISSILSLSPGIVRLPVFTAVIIFAVSLRVERRQGNFVGQVTPSSRLWLIKLTVLCHYRHVISRRNSGSLLSARPRRKWSAHAKCGLLKVSVESTLNYF